MQYDLIVIGAGPGGYVAAIRAGQTGLKTLVVDKKYVGGMCLNWGCIPTKALLESAKTMRKVLKAKDFGIDGIDPSAITFNWVQARHRMQQSVQKLSKGIEFLWKKNGVEYIQGEARIISPQAISVDNRIIETKNIIIATGSRPAVISKDVMKTLGNNQVIELEDFFSLSDLPEKPLIFGRGAVAAELSQFFKLIGKEPVILMDQAPLLPLEHSYLNQQISKILKKDKIPILNYDDAKIKDSSIEVDGKSYKFDAIVNCSLRTPVIPPMEIELSKSGGKILVNGFLQTSIPSIYAVGDVNELSFLAHSASAQGLFAVNHIQGKTESFDGSLHPVNIYTEPEIAHIGKSEEELKTEGIEYKISEFSLSANGKAMIEGNTDGSVRLLHETRYNQVLGIQIVSTHATDMIAEAGVLLQLEGTVFDLAQTIHAHPTVSEVFMEAGMLGSETPLHK